MYKIAVLSSTNGTNFQSIIDAKKSGVLSENVEIACLITNRECGAVDKAKAAEIPFHIIDQKGRSREEFDREVMKILDKHDVNLIVLGGYMRIIGGEMVEKYKHQMINIHPSLLPKYPGMDLDVHAEVIKAGEMESGMTIHFIDEGVDTGTTILQKKVELSPDETPESLKKKVQKVEKEWYPKVVQYFADDKIRVEDGKVTIYP